MLTTLLGEFSILINLSIIVFNNCVLSAITNDQDQSINSLYDYKTNPEYDKSGKCEIRIVTSGVCSVNNHLVKPTIRIAQPSQLKRVPVYKNPQNEARMRDMNAFKIEQGKANNLVDEFLVKFREHYGPELDPMFIKQFGRFRLKNIGTVRVYDMSLKGISNMKREGSVRLHSDSQMKLWSINTNLSVVNITSEFKVDAKLNNKVFINGWTLQVLIGRCLLNAIIELNANTKMMSISSLMVNTIEGFDLNSENLSWPFSQVVRHILDYQMKDLKSVISANAQKYLSQTIRAFDVTKIVDNLNDRTINLQN